MTYNVFGETLKITQLQPRPWAFASASLCSKVPLSPQIFLIRIVPHQVSPVDVR